MTITPIGFVIIPLSLVIFLARPGFLVPWAILVSVFQAASVINVGGGGSYPVGIAPFFFVVVLIALRFVPQYLTGRFWFSQDDPILTLFRPLTFFGLWGIASAFVLPFLFANVAVNNPRAGMDTAVLPLHWSLSNAAQAGYLLLDCIFLFNLTKYSIGHRGMEAIVWAFRWAGLIALAIGAYQLVAHNTGLPYPEKFFDSNEAYRQLGTEKIAGTWRLSSTFTEPSVAGAFFAAWSVFMLVTVADGAAARRLDSLLLSAGLVMLVFTTSSTGYVTAAIVFSMAVLQQIRTLLVRGRISIRALLVGVVIAFAIVGAIAFIPAFDRLLQEVLFQKVDSVSGRDRTATQWQSLSVARESAWLGVGLGSNRPSGMLFYILSNLGLPGLLLFSYCVYVTFVLVRHSIRRDLNCATVRGHLLAAGWSLAVTLLAMTISGAEVTMPMFWIAWGLTVGAIAHASESLKRQPVVSAGRQASRLVVLRRTVSLSS
jgi:hypothetical protein